MTFAHVFDIAAACLLAFFMVRGGMRGLTGEIIALIGLIASVICGWTFAQPLADIILSYFPSWNKTITQLVCSVAIFIFISLVFAAITKMLQLLIRAANLSMLDHVLGVFSGAMRAFFVVLFIYGVIMFFPVLPKTWMNDSAAMKGAQTVWPFVSSFLTKNEWINVDSIKSAASSVTIKGIPISQDNLLPAMPALPALADSSEDAGK